MSTPDPVRQPNEEPAQQANEQAGVNPQPPPAGRFAGVANRRVVVKAQTLAEVVRRLDELGVDRQGVEIWEAGRDSDKIEYVWSCRRIPPGRGGPLPGTTLFPDNPIMQRNEEVARRINQEARSDPTSPYAGKWVVIVKGQVAATADSWEELHRTLHRLGADPAETYCVEASRDYDEVMDIG
jgi:hypothetical protein